MAKKNPGGAPTKMTPETLQKLEEAFLLGCTDEEACFYAEISTSSLYTYQSENDKFLERKKALKQNPFFKARKTVVDNLDDNPDFALKYLERKKKDEFSTQTNTRLSGDPDNPIKQDHKIEIVVVKPGGKVEKD